MNIYKSKPLKYENEIPIFSFSDEYIENYNKIGKDVLKNIDIHGENPFMPENYWNSIENSTLLLIEKYIKKNDKILDVGVGLGRLLAKINQDVEKFGVDIDINQLVKSKDSINITSFFSKNLEMKLIKYFILPIEINMVLKKKCNTKK